MPKTIPQGHRNAMVQAYLGGMSAAKSAALLGYCGQACLNAVRDAGHTPRTCSQHIEVKVDAGKKQCSRCKEWKPFECFSPDRAMRLGYKSTCKECCTAQARAKYHANIEEGRRIGRENYERHKEERVEYSRRYAKENPEKVAESKKKTYSKHRQKHLDYAKEYVAKNKEAVKSKRKKYQEENRDDLLARRREIYRENPEAARQARAEWRKANPGKMKAAYKRRWVENREKEQEKIRQWREKNAEWMREYGKVYREKNAEVRRRWRQENKAKLTEYKLARKGRLIENGGSFSESEWKGLCAKFEGRCLKCGEVKPLTPDHVVPVSKGGRNNIENIQPLCGPCNSSKGAKTIDYRLSQEVELEVE